MESRIIGRIAAVLLAVVTVIMNILGPCTYYKSGCQKGDIYFWLFLYILVFLFLIFSSRKWLRVVSLIGCIILNLWLFEEIIGGYGWNGSLVFYVVMLISNLASCILAFIFPKENDYDDYPPVSRPLSDDYIRSTEAYKQIRDMLK